MERITEPAKKIEIHTVTSDKWIVHWFHQTLSQQVLKEIKSYFDPGIKFDKATVRQIIKSVMDVEVFSKDSRKIRASKVLPQGG